LKIINSDPFFREAFQTVGYLDFCEKIQRGHPEVAKQFALSFNGVKTKVGILDFEIIKHPISTTTKILVHGEIWFKAMSLMFAFSKELLKHEYQEDNLSK